MAAVDYTAVVQQLYISYFGRPADASGLANFTKQLNDMGAPKTLAEIRVAVATKPALATLVNSFSSSPESVALYGTGNDEVSIGKFISAIYTNVLNREADLEGWNYWKGEVISGRLSKANAALAITQGALENATAQGLVDKLAIENKLAVATDFTEQLDTPAEINAFSGDAAAKIARDMLHTVDSNTNVAAFHATVTATIVTLVGGGTVETKVLTNGTDKLSGHSFEAGLVYNPAGTDRINSLQSEDVLTGDDAVDSVLNATLGNANDNGATSVTPTLNGIEIVNLDITGNTNTLDVRFANSLSTLSINKLTAEAANAVAINNIGQPAANLTVKNSALVNNTVSFNYVDGVLAGQSVGGTLTLSSVAAQLLHVGNVSNTEGFENLTLNSTNTNIVKTLRAVDLENLTINGSGNLSLLNTTPAAEHIAFTAGALAIGDGIGIRSINAAGFSGTLNIDVSTAVGKHTDPANSGAPFYATITGGSGNDTFWTGTNIVGESATLFDAINGGAGVNTVRTYASILPDASKAFNAKITNVKTLEMRQLGATQLADLDAFDANLTTVIMRDENSANGFETFQLDSVSKTLAESGNIILRHAADSANTTDTGDTWGGEVKVNMKDASGTSDTVIVKVENDLNQESVFNYTLTIDGDTASQKVENVTINDAETESNTVILTKAAEHTGTVKLMGGVAGQTYTVTTKIEAATLDASAQLSDLRLNVGNATSGAVINQTIKLGTGNDILTFADIDSFNGADSVTDGGGTDTMRAAFSKDVVGAPTLTGIEKLHIVATANATLDMAAAATVTELAILSNTAVDKTTSDKSPVTDEPFGITGVDKTDTITLNNTALATLNYFADNDTDDTVGATSNSPNHIFNAVTLANNSVAALTVNINSSLDVDKGATSYTLGKITAHGVTSAAIVVANQSTVAKTTTLTSIENIYAKNLATLTVKATGNVNLGLVSGNATNNNLTTLDASAVTGELAVQVNSLGDAAVVTAGGSDAWIDARNSAGKSATFNALNGENTIYTAAGNDTVNAGEGTDVISVDRGQNIVRAGGGDDFVVGSNQDNTVDAGTGFNLVNFNRVFDADGVTLSATGLVATAATNTLSVAGGVATGVIYDDTMTVVREINLGSASTNDSVTLSFLGAALQSATRNGTNAITTEAAFTGGAADDFFVQSAAGGVAGETGGDGSDMLIGSLGNDVLGGDAGNDILSGNAGNDTLNGGTGNDLILGGTGDDTLLGGDGDDTIYAGDGVDSVTGGTGSDTINLASNTDASQWTPGSAAGDAGTVAAPSFAFKADAMVDTVVIAVGDSTATAYDHVTGFNVAADILDLGAALAITAGAVNGADSGLVKSHSVTAGGVVTFDDIDVYAAALIVSSDTDTAGNVGLADVLAYLGVNVANGDSVAFAYDVDGDGVMTAGVDSTFVFQGGVADTVVELVGVVGVTTLAGAAAANTIAIV